MRNVKAQTKIEPWHPAIEANGELKQSWFKKLKAY